jgi:hypothetical protein
MERAVTFRICDLYAGTKSIHHWAEAYGVADQVEIVTVDVQPVWGKAPTHMTSTLDWDFKAAYPPGHFHCVWASPPCTQFSVARTTAKTPRDLEGADRLVQRALEIIDYFKPLAYYLENPETGLMKTRPYMAGIPHAVADYCAYGFCYRKSTRIWSNLTDAAQASALGLPRLTLRRCDKRTCPEVVPGSKPLRHRYSLSCSAPRVKPPGMNKWMAGRLPDALLEAAIGPVLRAHRSGALPAVPYAGHLAIATAAGSDQA